MFRQAFREKIKYQLADTANQFWTDADLNAYIQEAYGLFVAQTQLFWGQAYLNDRANTALASLPSNFLKVDRVLWDHSEIPELTTRQLRSKDAQYRTLTSAQIYGYVVEQEDKAKLRKYPVPDVNCPTDGVDTLNTRLDYFQAASALSSDGSAFACPDWCLKYIRSWVMYRAYSQKGESQDLKLAEHFRQRFAGGIGRMIRRMNRIDAERIGVLGGAASNSRSIPTPKLPWEFGRVVRRF